MNDTLKHFLLVYDIKRDRELSVDTFEDEDEAFAAYEAAEAAYDDPSTFAVVLVSSDSIDTVRRTHSTYFTRTSPELSLRHAG